ncbi:hypothetical protein [Gorillibacterium sp. sgz5001074]|uniref:hypothetical protein n=1 Tax=Gorillibacterium sp. sgz5001074 TaxID=3446695 RepID=UPI003F681EB6
MDQQVKEYEMFRDPFRMLTLLVDLICQEKGCEFQWEQLPSYENEVFSLKPDAPEGQPQFVYKPEGTEIGWYQSFGRDIHCNKPLTRAEYNQMFVECMASLYRK